MISLEKLENLLEKLDASPSAKLLNDISLAIVQQSKLSKKINRLEKEIYIYPLLEN